MRERQATSEGRVARVDYLAVCTAESGTGSQTLDSGGLRRLIRGGFISIRGSISRAFGRRFGSFILGVIRFARSGLRIGGGESFLMMI